MEIKEIVLQKLMKEFREGGLEHLIKVSDKLLKDTEHGRDYHDEKSLIKGELAEVTLMCILQEFRKLMCKDSILAKGIFIQDTKSNQVTELDVTLITEYAIYLFECKSYSGRKKELKGLCELYINDELRADVFEQNKLHVEIFNREYGGFTKKGSKPYRIILYDYATNKFRDRRDEQTIARLPVLNQDTLLSWMSSNYRMSKEKGKCVDMDRVYTKMKLNEELREKDLARLHRKQLNY